MEVTLMTYFYNSDLARPISSPTSKRHLLAGLSWLQRRWRQQSFFLERIMVQLETAKLVSERGTSYEAVVGENLHSSKIRMVKCEHVETLKQLIQTQSPEQVSNEEIEVLRNLFQDLVLATVFAINSARLKKVSKRKYLVTDLHFYSRALAALARTDEDQLLCGAAYPLNFINAETGER
jgi:hypothetical protein